MINADVTHDEKGTVLIVDDNVVDLHVLSNVLRDEYNIVAANSGKTALERFRVVRPDIILLDIMMPDMDGYEVLKALKEEEGAHDIPVIFISGLTSPEEETKGLFLGAVDYIFKPFNKSVVLARVNTHYKIARNMKLIERLGLIDPLTEIPNRRRFDQQLEIEWGRARRDGLCVSLLILDVDDFKAYNDTYGHPTGDSVLQAIAKTITQCLNRASDLGARTGGEEFAVLLPSTDTEGAKVIGERIRASIEELGIPSAKNPEKSVTVSIGLHTVWPQSPEGIRGFIESCDKKLYEAKSEGKNRLVY